MPVVGGSAGHVKLAMFGYHFVKIFEAIAHKLKRNEQAELSERESACAGVASECA